MTQQTIHHDGQLDMATGRHRKETNWKNKQVMWSDLVTRLATTHRTSETFQEYLSAKKPRQDEIKDVGGFVGGYITGGRRKSGSVLHRQLLTLDIDFAGLGTWDDFTLLYDNAAVLYSTHKHSPEAPRLRLIMPLDREVGPDEYVAIARRIAGVLGIEQFDHTTYQPERFMYWPSTARDGAYRYEVQDGPWLSADQVLATYRDWRDSSEWPTSTHETEITLRDIKKQGDPLEKPGIIGAFCRTHSIADAIEAYLTDVYDACDDGRYTYKEGSTSAGLVVYDDRYAYSHHGTDPVSGKLCNAFDLVRLHRFGLKDEDAQEGTPSNKLPSFIAMTELASKDPAVRKQLGTERLQDARTDFEDDLQEGAAPSDEWLADMDVDKKGNYYSTIDNIIRVLKNDPALKGRFAINQFERREVALRNLPWRKITPQTAYLTDVDDAGVRHYLESVYNITGVQKVQDGLNLVISENGFHPVREYLEGLTWDGVPRAERLLVDYLGAEDNVYVRTVTRKILAAAVTRIFRPGAKFDYVLVMVGKQGLKKSSLIDALGGKWFSDSFSTIQGKEAYEQIQGVWLVEMGELAGLKKAEVETVKHFISKRVDRYRVAYGRRIEDFPRQCVFFATTNNRDFLRDPTGNRRFWPVDVHVTQPVKDVFQDLTEAERGQIWAEAMEWYRGGEALYLPKEIEAMATAMQAEHSEQDERAGMIQRYLDTLLPENWEQMDLYQRRGFLAGDDLAPAGTKLRTRVCVAEIWCEVLGGQQKDMTKYNVKEIHDIMRSLSGWEFYKGKLRFGNYGVQKGYVRQQSWQHQNVADVADMLPSKNLTATPETYTSKES
ncbi:VapE domain-containing protein [Chitinophaga sp. NPDC101104]|uniref:VapE domain-containing protein n=1 Tax=Chitinophaga sp. NPDC101104 TaxID=3390561 RepID=UPI003CFC2E59